MECEKVVHMKITNVKTILTAPEGINLVVVKIETSEPGLYGLGCATFTYRSLAVAAAVEEYLKPFLKIYRMLNIFYIKKYLMLHNFDQFYK